MKQRTSKVQTPPICFDTPACAQPLLVVANPVIAARNRSDQRTRSGSGNRRSPFAVGRYAALTTIALFCSSVQAVAQRIFLFLQKLRAGPDQRDDRGESEHEKQNAVTMNRQALIFASLRITRIPTISEMIA